MTDGTAELVDAEAADVGPAAGDRGRERRLMALICAGHFCSHFYMLTLPPLFLLLKDHFAVSYAALGLIMTVYHVSTGAIQAPMGFLVDRFGARHILILGLALNGIAIALMGVVDNYMLILVFAVFGGLGNSVFHPADYAIMADRIDASRLGRAIGIHMFAGNLGWVAAPLTMTTLAALWNWRIALIIVGLAGVAVALAMALQGGLLGGAINAGKTSKGKDTPKGHQGVGLLMSPPMLAFLAFFVMMASVTSGLQSFSTTALVNLHGISLTAANAALTAFICANAAGVLFGGFISDGLKR
ncbi:MAG: MFS transporter, partial [Alphaproteobacteria bacterium]